MFFIPNFHFPQIESCLESELFRNQTVMKQFAVILM